MGRVAQWLLIRRGEGGTVAYLGTLYLIIGLGMGLGHSSSDALFFKRVGVAYLPYMLFFISFALVIFSAVYAEFVDRIRPWRLFQTLFISIMGFLLASWVFMRGQFENIGFALYFIGYSVISEIIIVHFNLYASNFFDASQSKRLSPLINACARLGVIGGGIGLALVASLWPTEHMALAWLALIFIALVFIGYRHRSDSTAKTILRKRERKPFAEIREGLRFARRSALLKLTGIGVFIMIILVSVQDYLVSMILTAHYPDERSLAAFFGWFSAITNMIVLILQLTTTNRLMQRFGLKTVNLIFPWSTILSFGLLSLSASFIPAVIARFNYRGMLHAFRNPAANTFYNALPSYMQGRARALTIGLILPLGLAAAGLLLIFIPKSLTGERLALLALGASIFYLYFKTRKNKVYGETLIELIQSQVYLNKRIDLAEFGHFDAEVIEKIADLLKAAHDEDIIESYAEILLAGAPDEGAPILLALLPSLSFSLQDRLLSKLAAQRAEGWEAQAERFLESNDFHLRATALKLLFVHHNPCAEAAAQSWITSQDPRLRSAAAGALLVHSPPQRQQALQALLEMLSSNNAAYILGALDVIQGAVEPEIITRVRGLTQHPDARIRALSLLRLSSLCAQANDECAGELAQAQGDPVPEVRIAAVRAASWHANTDQRLKILHRALEDEEFRVRRSALDNADGHMPVLVEEYRLALHDYTEVFAMQLLLCKALGETEFPEKHELLVEIGTKHGQIAYQKKSAATRLERLAALKPGESRVATFLGLVLREEIQRHINLILKILESLDEYQSVRAIRAALASGDRRLRAYGLESLRNTRNSPLLQILIPLLEAEHDAAEWRRAAPQKFVSVEEVRQWCARAGSNWLQQCAIALAQTKGP